MTMANREIKKIHFTKDFANEVLTFEKWQKSGKILN
jgi:hypothetical protein